MKHAGGGPLSLLYCSKRKLEGVRWLLVMTELDGMSPVVEKEEHEGRISIRRFDLKLKEIRFGIISIR